MAAPRSKAVKAIDGLNCIPSANAKDQFYRAFEIPMVSREGAAILSTYPLNTECTCQHNYRKMFTTHRLSERVNYFPN